MSCPIRSFDFAQASRIRAVKLAPARECLLGVEAWCREGESNPQDPKVGGF
jgi:hypothetical protein